MKLNEYSIFEIATRLDIPLQGNSFVHNCQETKKPNALLYENNSFYCKHCGAFGDNKALIESFKKFETEDKLNFWASSTLNDYESYISLGLQDMSFNENMSRLLGDSLCEAQKNSAFHAHLQNKYGFDADDIIHFQIGYVSEKALSSIPDEFIAEYRLERIINTFIIPVVQNGIIASIKSIPLVEGITIIINKPDRIPVPCFNYNLAKQGLEKNKGFTALLYCENELDVLALRKHCNIETAVATSQIAHMTAEEKRQLAELSSFASDTMILWSETYDFEKEITQSSISLIEKGIDVHVVKIPKIGKSVAEYLKIATHSSILKDAIREQMHGAKHPFLANYIEQNRLQLHKIAIRRRICELIAYLPSQTIEIYQKQLAHIPASFPITKDVAFNIKYIVHKTVSSELIKECQREINKSVGSDIVLSDNKETEGSRFYAQDYWHDLKDNKLNALKVVYTKVNKTNRQTQEGLVSERVPIAIRAKANSVGNTTFEFKTLNLDAMDDLEFSFLPMFDSTASLEQWQIHGDTPYSFQSFLQAKGDVDVDTKQLYNDIKTILSEYYYFKNPLYADILTAYIMMTYVNMLVDNVPYLHIMGKASSGKSLLVELMYHLCFNSEKFVGANHAHIFRLVHGNRSTLFLNEEESLSTLGSTRNNEILPTLKDSYSKTGGWVPRFKDGAGSRGQLIMTKFFVYSPKIFSGTRNIEAILSTRTINIDTHKIPDELISKLKNYNVDKLKLMAQFQDIRNRLMVWSMVDYYRFHQNYIRGIDILRNKRIGNRDLDLWSPIFGVISCVESEEKTISMLESFTREMLGRRNTLKLQSNIAEVAQVFVDVLHDFTKNGKHKTMGIYKNLDPTTGKYEYFFNKNIFFRKFQTHLEATLSDNWMVVSRYQNKGDVGSWARRSNDFGKIFEYTKFFRDIPSIDYKRNRQILRLSESSFKDLMEEYGVIPVEAKPKKKAVRKKTKAKKDEN
jgi:hypothetical protein